MNQLDHLVQPFDHLLPDTFRESVRHLAEVVPEQMLRRWLDSSADFAGSSKQSDSQKTVRAFLLAGIEVLPRVDEDGLQVWSEGGRRLAERAPLLAAAYFDATPEVLSYLSGRQVGEWADLGSRLFGSTAKSLTLACDFFALSPLLLSRLSYGGLQQLAALLESISRHTVDHSLTCLEGARAMAESHKPLECQAFLNFVTTIAETNWSVCGSLLNRGPVLLPHVEAFSRVAFIEFFNRAAPRLGKQAHTRFAETALALKDVRVAYHGRLIELADRLLGLSVIAAVSFLKNASVLTQRLSMEGLERWYDAGLDIFAETGAGGEAYFQLEATRSEQVIEELTARVDLSRVGGLLGLYCKALTGQDVSVQSVRSLEDRGIGWVQEGGASTEGTAIFLPEHIEEFDSKAENFSVYKAYATHQAAHLEFGSFEFDFMADGNVVPRRRGSVESQRRAEGLAKETWLTDMERFFNLFQDRELASDLFGLVEDMRIDIRTRHDYGGIREVSHWLQEVELTRRPNLHFLPLRQAFVESLLRISLDGETSAGWPRQFEAILQQGIDVLNAMRNLEATVEDAAEATLQLYELAERVPNLPAGDGGYLDEMSIVEMEEEGMNLRRNPKESLDKLRAEELPYETLNPVSFRGDFKPELVQLLVRMRSDPDEDHNDDLTPDNIKEFIENSVEIDKSKQPELDTLIHNMETEASREGVPEGTQDPRRVSAHFKPTTTLEVTTSYYDEWDFRAKDYRPRWCTLHERRMAEGNLEFFEETLLEYAEQVKETQRQFELIRPEPFRKLKRLEDGEDIDLDTAIEFLVQRRAGHGDSEKIYWRRNKDERQIAVAFLLDMSSSTEQVIDKEQRPRKRIIDLEKESLVLLTRALEISGDHYGIYGFSGDGRQNVEYYVVKDITEPFGDTVRRRIDRISSLDSTRMAPAIRHTIPKLLEIEARARILFLISDGRPQDTGYGAEPGDREYAINDTHKALMEAKRKGITPFLITVDKEGHDYLGEMCGDMAYEVLTDIKLLPSRLLTLYRMLTAD